jgi:hypothetical protein
MYGTVPRIMPGDDRSLAAVGAEVRLSIVGAGRRAFARPKSRSLIPDFVTMTLDGFKSRWIIPLRWAASSAEASELRTDVEREELRDPLGEGLALEQLHDEILMPS